MNKETLDPIDKYDEYHAHEVLDRLHLAQSMLSEMFDNHPFLIGNPEIAKKVAKAQDLLFESYQAAGALGLEEDNREPTEEQREEADRRRKHIAYLKEYRGGQYGHPEDWPHSFYVEFMKLVGQQNVYDAKYGTDK